MERQTESQKGIDKIDRQTERQKGLDTCLRHNVQVYLVKQENAETLKFI